MLQSLKTSGKFGNNIACFFRSMSYAGYGLFSLIAVLLVFPSLELGNAYPIQTLLFLAIVSTFLDGILCIVLVRHGEVEGNPFLNMIIRRMGITYGVIFTRLIGITLYVSLALLGLSVPLLLAFLIMVLASTYSIVSPALGRS